MFNQLTVIGVGLIGGSLARAVRRNKLARKITGFSITEATGARALELGVVDEMGSSVGAAVGTADIVVVATPMQAMRPLLKDIASSINEGCTLTDVGSVKQSLIDDVAATSPGLMPQFVPAHPIAGIEASGVEASFAELFDDKNVVLTPTEKTSAEHIERVSALWRGVGSRVLTMSASEHDKIFARTSHLPHIVAYALVDYMARQKNSGQLFDLAAGGFYDFTRIASSDPVMWRDICLTNRDAILESLSGYQGALESLRKLIVDGDGNGIERLFESSRTARNSGLERKR